MKRHIFNSNLSLAVRMVRDRRREDIELKHKRYTWKEGEEGFVPTQGEDWMQLITLPALGSEY